MTHSPRRMFLAVFLVVFLGGLGVSGASALGSGTVGVHVLSSGVGAHHDA